MKAYLLALVSLVSFTFNATAQLADGSTAPDFTAVDINGNSHSLYSDYLDNGMPVIIDVSATWCGPCWSFHEAHTLKDLYNVYGPGGSNEIGVLFVEGDANTGQADLEGTTSGTQGNWIEGTPYPIIDDNSVGDLLEISFYPTIYGICPDGTIYEFGQSPTASVLSQFSANCGVSPVGATDNSSLEDNTNIMCIAGESVTPSITLCNYGTNNLTSATIELFEEGNAEAIETVNWQGNLASLATTTVEFSEIDNVQNELNFDVVVSQPNGTTDMYTDGNEGEIFVSLAGFTSENLVKVVIVTDNYPGEITWELNDGNGNTLASFGPYEAGTDDQYGAGGPDAMQTFEYPVALPAGVDCYELNIDDSFGDGISLSSLDEAGYAVYAGNTAVIENMNKPNFGFNTKENFGADSDGEGTTSIIEENNISVSLYPNPISSNATISVDLLENANATLEIVDVLGKTIMRENYSLNSGNNTIGINVDKMTNGIYFAHLSINGEINTVKITVSK